MKKNELVAAVAEKTGMTKKDTLAFLDTVLDTITEALVEGDKVSLLVLAHFQ